MEQLKAKFEAYAARLKKSKGGVVVAGEGQGLIDIGVIEEIVRVLDKLTNEVEQLKLKNQKGPLSGAYEQ